MEETFILFGFGKVSIQAIKFFGKKAVHCFVDNHITREKENSARLLGMRLLDFDAYRKIANQYETILSMNRAHADEVALQLRDAGISNYIYWDKVIPALYTNNPTSTEKKLADFLHRKYSLKRDMDSQVEFYLVDSFEISHFWPIYESLRKNGIRSCFVAEPCWLNTAGEWFDYENSVRLLQERGVKFSTLSNPNASLVFTTQYPCSVSHYRGKRTLMFYGVNFFKAKVFSLRKEVAQGFDCIFTHGEFDVQKLLQLLPAERVVDMAYPRYRDYFLNPPNKDGLKNELIIDTEKPILLYCPTWDQFSSIAEYADALMELRRDFYIVAKSHHCTYRLGEKKKDMETLCKICDKVLPGTFALEKAVSLADIAVCDATSGVFAELMFLRPDMRLVAISSTGAQDGFFFDISELAMIVHFPEELEDIVRQAWRSDACRTVRKQRMPHFFSPDIKAGIQRTVEKVLALI